MAVILTLFISTTKLHIIFETTKFLGYSLQDLREAPDVQAVATASCFLQSVEETTIVSHILYATLEHIADTGLGVSLVLSHTY